MIVEGRKIDSKVVAEIVGKLRDYANKIERGDIVLDRAYFTRMGFSVYFDRYELDGSIGPKVGT